MTRKPNVNAASGTVTAVAEALFDDLTRLAAETCDAPIAALSLVENGHHWLKSRGGAPASSAPPETLRLCTETLGSRDGLALPDVTADGRFASTIPAWDCLCTPWFWCLVWRAGRVLKNHDIAGLDVTPMSRRRPFGQCGIVELVEQVEREADDESGPAADVEQPWPEFRPQALEHSANAFPVLRSEVRLALVVACRHPRVDEDISLANVHDSPARSG